MRVPFEPEWFGGHAEHYFRRIRPGIEEMPWGTLDPSNYPPELVKRAQLSWTEAAYNEYCTAVAFSELLQALLEVNAPVDLVAMCGDFMADEMLHVELTCRLAMELGGGADYRVDFEGLRTKLDPNLTALQRANEMIIRLCCVGEAFSLPMLAGCLKSAAHPLTQAVLEQIVRDEALHGKLGFMYLEWVEDRLDAAECDRLALAAVDTIRGLSPLWRRLRSQVHGDHTSEGYLIGDIRQLGWMLSHEYRAAACQAVRDEVCGPLAEFGIHLPAEQVDELIKQAKD